MNRDCLRRHCEAMCKRFENVPTSGTYEEHKLVLDLLNQTEWIPASLISPEEDGEYFVTMKCGFEETEWTHTKVDSYRFSRGGWASDDVDGKVIAWMPLPEEYKEEKTNELQHNI